MAAVSVLDRPSRGRCDDSLLFIYDWSKIGSTHGPKQPQGLRGRKTGPSFATLEPFHARLCPTRCAQTSGQAQRY